MTLEIRQFNCPKCGTQLDLKNAGRSKSIICPSCGSQIDLSSPEYQILGNVGNRIEPQVTPFKLGMRGAMEGQEYEIIGRVVYHDDEGDIWDEWLLLSAAGEYVWISDSANEGMALWHSFVPVSPVEPDTLNEGDTLVLRKERVTVRDIGGARIDYLEGELTWKATVGDRIKYAEVDSPTERISIEYTQDEVEFYWGGPIDRAATAMAFGVPKEAMLATTRAHVATAGGSRILAGIGGLFTLLICVAILCVVVAVFGANGGVASSSPICVTPTTVVGIAPTPGPSPTPSCYVPTPRPGSGGIFRSSGPSIRSSSPGRSPSGGGGSRGGGK